MKMFKINKDEKMLLDGKTLVLYRKRCKPRVLEYDSSKTARAILKEYKKIKLSK